jgi:pimeloyl-ACP methyl ester carboxylesterase
LQALSALIALVFLFLVSAFVLWPDGATVHEMGSNRTTTSADGTTIAYTRLGSGPPLILVDGAFCYRENGPASALAPLLAEHFTVFSYDRRGRGASGDAPRYAIEREVEDLRALVREAGGTAFVAGISSGSALALRAAASGPGLAGLVLYEPPFIQENGHPRSYVTQQTRLRKLVAAGDRAGAVRFFMTEIYGAPGVFVSLMPIIMRSGWKKNQSVAHTLPRDLALLDDWSVLRNGSVTVPTLVVGGANSPTPLKAAVAVVARTLPNARALYLEGQNHNVSAPAIAPSIIAFFDQTHEP